MTGLILLIVVIIGVVALARVAGRRNQAAAVERTRAELEPVKALAFEDVTALGTDLQDLDAELAGQELDEGARADYQRGLDAYEAAKTSVDRLNGPDEVRHVTEIIEDGRYAIACVRARVAGAALPTRRPPCFFDPRHGLSVAEVEWAPPSGAPREVPACALDAERVRAGAEPDTRQVMVGAQRMPYYQGGPAYAPYAAGYFGGMNLLFTGLLIGSLFDGGPGFGDGYDGYDGGDSGVGGDGGTDAGDGGGGDVGGGDGGGFFDGGGDFGGDFGGFDF